MGDHYVPKYYLNGFTSDYKIWVFDKTNGKIFHTQPKSIANEKNLYGEIIENYLANEIEGPANDVLDKIRSKISISPEEKSVLSNYIVTLLKRVPEGKEQSNNLISATLNEINDTIDEKASVSQSDHPAYQQVIKFRTDELKKLIKKIAIDNSKELWLQTLKASKTPNIINGIKSMTWVFLYSDNDLSFITSDNPVFYFKSMGIGKIHSELTFPISTNISLWATWRSDLKEGYYPTQRPTIHEINRRTASNLTRFAFNNRYEKWILPFIQKGEWKLNMLR